MEFEYSWQLLTRRHVTNQSVSTPEAWILRVWSKLSKLTNTEDHHVDVRTRSEQFVTHTRCATAGQSTWFFFSSSRIQEHFVAVECSSCETVTLCGQPEVPASLRVYCLQRQVQPSALCVSRWSPMLVQTPLDNLMPTNVVIANWPASTADNADRLSPWTWTETKADAARALTSQATEEHGVFATAPIVTHPRGSWTHKHTQRKLGVHAKKSRNSFFGQNTWRAERRKSSVQISFSTIFELVSYQMRMFQNATHILSQFRQTSGFKRVPPFRFFHASLSFTDKRSLPEPAGHLAWSLHLDPLNRHDEQMQSPVALPRQRFMNQN